MRLQQWSPNWTRNGITSEQKSTLYQGRTSKIIQTKSKSIRPNRNQLYSYVGPYRSLWYEQLEVSHTCRNNVGTSIIFITSTIPNLTGRSFAGALFDQHSTIAPRAHNFQTEMFEWPEEISLQEINIQQLTWTWLEINQPSLMHQ